jgi:transposase
MQDNYVKLIPKSPFAKAIAYALPRWNKLSIYTRNSRLQIDNNLIENSMRPVAPGRKNYLFAGSNEGGKRLALFYSLLENCKKHNVKNKPMLMEQKLLLQKRGVIESANDILKTVCDIEHIRHRSPVNECIG